MKPINETSKCDNCGAECPILESVSVVFGTLLWYLRCRSCGCFYTSEDKIHWDLAWQVEVSVGKVGAAAPSEKKNRRARMSDRLLTDEEIGEIMSRADFEDSKVSCPMPIDPFRYERAVAQAQDTKSVKARDIEILSQVHTQLKHYLECEPVITGLWDNISQYAISLEGELEALKRSIDGI